MSGLIVNYGDTCCARAARMAAGLLAGLALAVPGVGKAQGYGPVDEQTSPLAATTAIEPADLPNELLDAVNQSLAQSPIVIARLAEVAALRADQRTAERLRYPNLTAELLAATRGSTIADADGLAVNLALEQPIWAGGAIDGQIDAARATREAGGHALREARFNILLAVVDAYYDALLASERIRVLEQGIAEYRTLVVSIERRVAQEVSPYADLTLALSRLTQLEVDLVAAREINEEALLRLAEFVGGPVADPVMPDADLAAMVPDEALAVRDMMSCSPGLDRLGSEIDAAEARVRTARGNIWPQILLQLSQNEITGARAAIVLRAQTGNGLSRLTEVDSAEARVDQAIAELGQADREMRTRIRREYVALRSSRLRADAAGQANQAASDLLASYQRQFVAGRRSWLDVLNAAREVIDARVSQTDAEVLAAASATRIEALACRWRPEGV